MKATQLKPCLWWTAWLNTLMMGTTLMPTTFQPMSLLTPRSSCSTAPPSPAPSAWPITPRESWLWCGPLQRGAPSVWALKPATFLHSNQQPSGSASPRAGTTGSTEHNWSVLPLIRCVFITLLKESSGHTVKKQLNKSLVQLIVMSLGKKRKRWDNWPNPAVFTQNAWCYL